MYLLYTKLQNYLNFFNKFNKQKVETFPLIVTFIKWWKIKIHKNLIRGIFFLVLSLNYQYQQSTCVHHIPIFGITHYLAIQITQIIQIASKVAILIILMRIVNLDYHKCGNLVINNFSIRICKQILRAYFVLRIRYQDT